MPDCVWCRNGISRHCSPAAIVSGHAKAVCTVGTNAARNYLGSVARHRRNRFFAGTITFDDPAVADESILPAFSSINHPAQGTNVTDNRFNWSFDRLLTPTLAFTLDSGWIHRNWPLARSSGFDSTAVGLKTEIYRDNRHEALASAGVQWGIGHSGAAGVEADEPNTGQPVCSLAKALATRRIVLRGSAPSR